MRTENICSTET